MGLFDEQSYNTGRSWHLDRQQHNKSEDWEKPMDERKQSYAEGGGVDTIKFYEIANILDLDLEYDGDETDLRLHGEEKLNWGAETAAEYEEATNAIDAISYKGNGWEVYATYDVSGFDYWMMQQEEQNYLTMTIMFDNNTVDVTEITAIKNAMDMAYSDAYSIAEKYDYVPNSEYKRGGSVDGRSTRAKNTWNSGASWTSDRNQFNKCQDWEVPMNKRKYAQGGGIDNEFILTYSKNVDAIYAFRKEADEDGEGWIPSGRVVRSEDAIKKQVNSLADLAFVADLPMYDGVWTYDPIKNGAEIHFYRHTGYTTSGNLKLEIYYFIVEGDYKSKLESMSDYQLADLYIDDMGNYIDRNDLLIELRDNEAERKDLINKILSEKSIFGIDWLETACYNQNVKNGLREDVETIFQQYDYLNKFIEDKNDRIYANGGAVPRNVGRDWIFKSKQDWEQKYDRKREYKEYKKEGWLSNWFKEGGEAKDLSQYTEAELYNLYRKAEGNWKNDNGAEYERIQAELDRRFLNNKLLLLKSQGVYLPVSTADKYSNFQEMKNLFESNPSKAQKDEFFDRVLKINRNGKTYYATGYNLETRGRTYNLQDSQNALNYYKKNGYDAIIMESPIPTFQFIYDEFEKWQSNPSFIIMTTPALSKSEYKFEHGGETTGDLLDLWQEMGGEKKFQEEKNYDYGSDLTDESMVKNNLVDGEISADTLKQIVGCELSYPYQIVGAIKLQKCFMRPYYKLS